MKLMSSTTEYVATKTQEAHNCTWTVVYDLKINTLAWYWHESSKLYSQASNSKHQNQLDEQALTRLVYFIGSNKVHRL